MASFIADYTPNPGQTIQLQRATKFGAATDAEHNKFLKQNKWKAGSTASGVYNTIHANRIGLTKNIGYLALSDEKRKALGAEYGDLVLVRSPRGVKPVVLADRGPRADKQGKTIADLDPETHKALTPNDEGVEIVNLGYKTDMKQLMTPPPGYAEKIVREGMPTDFPLDTLIAGSGGANPVQPNMSVKDRLAAVRAENEKLMQQLGGGQTEAAQPPSDLVTDEGGITGRKVTLADGRKVVVWPGQKKLYADAQARGVDVRGKTPSQVVQLLRGQEDTQFATDYGDVLSLLPPNQRQAVLTMRQQGTFGQSQVKRDLDMARSSIAAYRSAIGGIPQGAIEEAGEHAGRPISAPEMFSQGVLGSPVKKDTDPVRVGPRTLMAGGVPMNIGTNTVLLGTIQHPGPNGETLTQGRTAGMAPYIKQGQEALGDLTANPLFVGQTRDNLARALAPSQSLLTPTPTSAVLATPTNAPVTNAPATNAPAMTPTATATNIVPDPKIISVVAQVKQEMQGATDDQVRAEVKRRLAQMGVGR